MYNAQRSHRHGGVGRVCGAGCDLGVGVGLGVAVGVTVGVGLGVGLRPDAQYLPPVLRAPSGLLYPPQTIISLPVHTAV